MEKFKVTNDILKQKKAAENSILFIKVNGEFLPVNSEEHKSMAGVPFYLKIYNCNNKPVARIAKTYAE